MKYSNLLRFLLTWDTYRKDVIDEDAYNEVMNDPDMGKAYKTELEVARKEYLEFIHEDENSTI